MWIQKCVLALIFANTYIPDHKNHKIKRLVINSCYTISYLITTIMQNADCMKHIGKIDNAIAVKTSAYKFSNPLVFCLLAMQSAVNSISTSNNY